MTDIWLWLSRKKGLGPKRIHQLLERFGTAQDLFDAGQMQLLRAGLPTTEAELLADKELAEAAAIRDACFRLGISILCWDDERYPQILRQIPDAPVVLYYKGRLPELGKRPSLALVGARKASAYGQLTAKTLGYQAARCGCITVTGLAAGIDAAAAEGALLGDGPVIGVLGCGADVVYPKSSRQLYREVESHGCILTEYPPGTAPFATHFPARNRIISGLCDGVVVVEAGEKSGALITANLALDQGRDVYAVPGPAGSVSCAGSNRLIKEGATLLETCYEAARTYSFRYPGSVTAFTGVPDPDETLAPDPDEKPAPQPQRPTTPAPEKPAAPAANAQPNGPWPLPPEEIARRKAGRSPEEQRIIEALRCGPMQLDLLIADTGLPTAKVLAVLTLMELRGGLGRLPGKYYTLK